MSIFYANFLGKLSRVLSGIPKDAKNEYRNFYFHSDIAQARIVIMLLAIAVALFGLSDYPFLGLSVEFLALEILRFGFVAYSVIVVVMLNRSRNHTLYDRSIFIYLLIFVLFSLLVSATRPEGYLVQSIIVGISIFVFYLSIPTRFLNQAILSTVYTIGELVLLLLTIPPSGAMDFQVVFSVLFFANAIAALTSWQFNYYRWLTFKDLNDRKKSERFVVIGQTAGMVGHDIRNPLQAITSDLYLIEDELKNNPQCTSQDIAESITSINENIAYIDKIVSDLQDYTRTLVLNPTLVNLKALFSQLLTTIPQNVESQLVVPDDLTIKTDATYLRRIMTNLVINAVQAMPNGGKITISTEVEAGKVLISMADTGIGIPEVVKPNLFKPMFTTKAKGQGLGLAVVKRLVEALNGSVSFESKVGEGSKFIVSLPLAN
ncbi:MAG TPA: ATP-binding protein [Candidatus Acidoferrales bacterium]|nr:ATP-binding protein [Candidatus Acidoferrales bacterium]